MKHIAIIGAGITGITTAHSLLKRGFAVTVFDKNRYAAMETSYANGGQLSACNSEVWNSWPTVLRGLRWMLDSSAPLLLNPAPSWHKYSWLAEFVAQIRHYRSNTIATTRLAIEARRLLNEIARDEEIEFDFQQSGILHVYRTKEEYRRAERVNDLLIEGGLDRHAVGPQEIASLAPSLGGAYFGGFFAPSDATGDIHKFTIALAAACTKRGADIRYNEVVNSLQVRGHRIVVGATHCGENEPRPRTFDGLVICAGVDSRRLAAMLGDRINVYPVKGHSITVHLDSEESKDAAPTVGLLDESAKIVTSRLGLDRFRVAGTAEFNGRNHDIRADRIQPMIGWVNTLFPSLGTRRVVPWCGLRPMMPDMMPRVKKGRRGNVHYNTGHGHLGWTLSAATAELISEQVSAGFKKAMVGHAANSTN